MKLVVSYTVGDGCTYSCQCDVPVEYESAEHLLVHIENEVSAYLERDAKRSAAWSALSGRQDKSFFGSDEYWTEHAAILEKFPTSSYDQKVAGTELYISHFIENGKLYAPTIYTVDEWFEAGARGDLG